MECGSGEKADSRAGTGAKRLTGFSYRTSSGMRTGFEAGCQMIRLLQAENI